MRSKLKKLLYALPFCVPFPFIGVCDFYYLDHNFPPLGIFIFPILTSFSVLCRSKGREKEMLAGSAVGTAVSVIVTSILNNGFDESRFEPINSMITVIILALLFYGAGFLEFFIKLIRKKRSDKKEKQS